MRKVLCVLGMLVAAGLTAGAQSAPSAEAFLGYSYVRAKPHTSNAPSFNLNGGSGSLAYNVGSSLGLVADFGGYRVGKIGNLNTNSTLYSYLFGPRLSYRGSDKITPFVQALFGGAHATSRAFGSASSANAFAMTLGGGLDTKVSNHMALRLVQGEYFLTRFRETSSRVSQNNFRLSTGLVFRF